MKRIAVFSVLCAAGTALFAQTTPATDFEAVLNADFDGAVIVGYRGEDPIVVIPGQIEGLPVVEIGENVFYGKRIKAVTLPASITSIGAQTFRECRNLASITMPGVKSIGERAFFGCTGLVSLAIPEGIASIGVSAFYNCTSLASLVIPESVLSIGKWAFYGCGGLTSVEITPVGSRSWGENVFKGCASLGLAAKAALKKAKYTGSF